MKNRILSVAWLSVATLCIALYAVSCNKQEDSPPEPPTGGFRYTLEDSSVVWIPDGAVTFAQQNYSRDAQLLREYQIATTQGWTLPLLSWKYNTFDVRLAYMVPPFSRDVMTDDSALFYYEIGEFMSQFGFGWKDTFDAETFNPDSAYTTHIWPNDPVETVYFDGQSAFASQYRGMWIHE